MEIEKHLVMDNRVFIGDELHVVEHLVVRNDIVGYDDLPMNEDLHMVVDIDLNSYVAIYFIEDMNAPVDVAFDV